MTSPMDNKALHCRARIASAAFLLLPLWLLADRLGLWSGVNRDLRLCLLCGTVAAATAVLLVPVIIRGNWAQRILGLVLIVMPLLSLVSVFAMAFGYYVPRY